MTTDLHIDEDQAIVRLMRFLYVEGITGQEEKISLTVLDSLVESGVERSWIRFDEANKKIPLPTQTGNLIVTLPGNRPGPRRLFMTHLDTVPLCAGAVPLRKGIRIVPSGKTALGGDNRTGVGCLVTMVATLLKRSLPHQPLTLLFTVREESGLWGARFVDPADLGNPVVGFNIDGKLPGDITIGAVGAERWEAEISGRAAHAGVHPEQGISATVVAAKALAEVHANGWFGKVKKKSKEGTSNVGSISDGKGGCAGVATNVVTDFVHVRGETRSHDAVFNRTITAAYKDAFSKAAAKVTDHRGRKAKVQFKADRDYFPFKLKENSPVVKLAQAAGERAGIKTQLRLSNGGLDANWTVRHGIPTITFGAGQNEIHTVDEYVELPDYLLGCKLALALATEE